jgi:hypothetical protein
MSMNQRVKPDCKAQRLITASDKKKKRKITLALSEGTTFRAPTMTSIWNEKNWRIVVPRSWKP